MGLVVLEMGSKISVMHLYTNKSAEKWRDGTPEMLKEKQEEKKNNNNNNLGQNRDFDGREDYKSKGNRLAELAS